jgi:protocatechuate 3,4-dioxygenase beta subunit
MTLVVGLGTQAIGVLIGSTLFQRGGRGTPAPSTQGQLSSQQTGTAVINGIVRNLATKGSIDSVTVLITAATEARGFNPPTTGPQSQTTTDNDGRFTFSKLPPGNYSLRAEREGYFGVSNQQLQQGSVNARVTISSDQSATNVVLELIPGGSIRGRIYDPNGRPLAAAQVIPLRESYQDGRLSLAPGNNAVTTDDRGEFRIWGLAPGRFYLRFQTRANAARNGPGTPAYYPGERDVARAQPIIVQSDREFVADVRLPPDTPMKISGRIVGVDPSIPTGVAYYLVRRDSEVWDNADVSARPLQVAARGTGRRGAGVTETTFELQALPGRYDVYAVAQTQQGPASAREVLAGKVPVDVLDRDIEGLTVTMRPTFDLRVRFVGNGDPQIGDQIGGTINVRARDQVPTLLAPRIMTIAERNAATAGLTGEAALQAMAASGTRPEDGLRYSGLTEGRYFLDSPLAQLRDAYIADIRQGTKSLYEDGTVVIGADPPEPIEVILARPAGTIAGVVQDSTNKPVASAQVVLIPDGRRRENPLLYKKAITSEDGRFTLSALAPGSYKVFAWEKAWENAWLTLPPGAERNARFLARFEQLGRSVNVSAGSTISSIVISVIRDRQ